MTIIFSANDVFDAVIIGGGFYGSAIAIYLARERGLQKILLVEREALLLTRASYNNQARVHNGYHYPRSFTTAYRSRINFPQFLCDWSAVIKKNFTKLYAIARGNSKMNACQFQRFCRDIGALLEPVDVSLRQLFDPRLIEDVFLAQEYVFDVIDLTRLIKMDLAKYGVNVCLNTTVDEVYSINKNHLQVSLLSKNKVQSSVVSRYVFNCTYSGINQIRGEFPGISMKLKHEIAEMALIQMPPILDGLGITVMDGPFFSMMPFPARNLHTLSHVRYTPHFHWQDAVDLDPYLKLEQYDCESRVDRMVRDASRYVPAISGARYIDSLFEIKTLLAKNEGNDERPILFEKHTTLPGCYSVLGGKIDNIYDVIEKLSRIDL